MPQKILLSCITNTGASALKESQKVAEDLFGCSKAELALLTNAIQDNACWLANAIRKQGLKKACLNEKLFLLMRNLFVLERPKSLMFYTDGVDIAKAIGADTKGLGWKRTPDIVRIRKNGIMNWGTSATTYDHFEPVKDPVILIPKKNLARQVVFFGSRKLVNYCYAAYKMMRSSDIKGNFKFQINTSTNASFWRAFYNFVNAVQIRRAERECFTFTERTPCQVYSISAKELLEKDSKLALVTRKPVALDDK